MRHVAAWVVLWLLLFWLWLLLGGQWDREQWVAAACAATVVATIGEVARARARANKLVPLRWVARARTVPQQVFVDFALLMYALLASLLRREVVRGRFFTRDFPTRAHAGVRAWVGWAATISPNAYVLEIDREQGAALVHDLIPSRSSESPV